MKRFLSFTLLTIVLAGSLAAHADRVGNDGSLAMSDIEKMAPGLDPFHRILYAFDHTGVGDIKKMAGFWVGIQLSRRHYKSAPAAEDLQQEALLGFKVVERGPLFERLVKGYVHGAYDDGWYRDQERVEKYFEEEGFSKGSMDVKTTDRITVISNSSPIELRQIKGAIVGVRRPQADGKCAPDFVQPVDGTCGVFYFYEKRPSKVLPGFEQPVNPSP